MLFIHDMLAKKKQKELTEKKEHPTHHSCFIFDIKSNVAVTFKCYGTARAIK